MSAKITILDNGAVIKGATLEECKQCWEDFNKRFPDNCYKFSNGGPTSDGGYILTFWADRQKGK